MKLVLYMPGRLRSDWNWWGWFMAGVETNFRAGRPFRLGAVPQAANEE